MLWVDYTVESFPDGSFHIKGEWPGEVMGIDKDGDLIENKNILYKPGDVFIVQENGILKKQEAVTALVLKYESSKNVNESST